MSENKHTMSELYQWQSLPLSVKVSMTKQRIRDWVNYYGEEGVYVSFSGGKDSTVLLDIARSMYPNIKAMFVDTGFDGISGFPLVFARCGCKPLWSSEIEEFPIAVCKQHFGDEDAGIEGDYRNYL